MLKLIDFGLSKVYKLKEELLKDKGSDISQFRGRRKRAVNMKTKAGTVRVMSLSDGFAWLLVNFCGFLCLFLVFLLIFWVSLTTSLLRF